jgi:TRAP-type C4-dicarboxylate transport system permease small subunit
MRALAVLRRGLDALYLACGVLAAGFLCLILVIIVAQMVARWTGHVFLGATAYAGYAMAASSFLAFAHALNRGAHIRVGVLLALAPGARRWIELWCYGVGTVLGWFLARYCVNAVWWSWKLGDVSQGQDMTPLWIAQTPMAVGAVVLAVCLTDHLVRTAGGVDTTPPDLAERLE